MEALQAVVGVDQISASSFEKALVDAGIDPNADYVQASQESINSAAVGVLNGFLVSSVSEGGFSIAFDRKAIETKIGQLSGAGVRAIKAIKPW